MLTVGQPRPGERRGQRWGCGGQGIQSPPPRRTESEPDRHPPTGQRQTGTRDSRDGTRDQPSLEPEEPHRQARSPAEIQPRHRTLGDHDYLQRHKHDTRQRTV